MDEEQATRAEQVRRWLTVAYYSLAVAGAALSVWWMVKDDPLLAAEWQRTRQWFQAKTKGCSGCKRRKEAINRMLWEAQQIVTRNKEEADGPGD